MAALRGGKWRAVGLQEMMRSDTASQWVLLMQGLHPSHSEVALSGTAARTMTKAAGPVDCSCKVTERVCDARACTVLMSEAGQVTCQREEICVWSLFTVGECSFIRAGR